MSQNPQFVLFCGPMMSSKTSALLMTLERYRYQNKTIAAFKPTIDDRYSASEIVTHNGFKCPAVTIAQGTDIIQYLAEVNVPNPDVIAVDEAFMIPGIAETLTWLYRNGYTVLVSSLDISATGKVFDEIKDMMPWATQIEKCTAICTVCGADAHYTHRKVAGQEIEVGGADLYEPRCFSHHLSVDLRNS